jgi:hypothetical protein
VGIRIPQRFELFKSIAMILCVDDLVGAFDVPVTAVFPDQIRTARFRPQRPLRGDAKPNREIIWQGIVFPALNWL